MPTYQYQCPNCGHEQESRHSIKEEPAVACECCETPMKRVLPGAPSFLVKGGKIEVSAKKAADDMAHARKVERTIKGKLQPLARKGMEKPKDP